MPCQFTLVQISSHINADVKRKDFENSPRLPDESELVLVSTRGFARREAACVRVLEIMHDHASTLERVRNFDTRE
jgi:hypothetical protein